ncbi:HNH endonuclease [Mesorhizobium mediterraneum]|uniref:HNH nuclease domain-containing protein n=1 Tax=Mesorhizobium mediterraneum TaxID=43617 RepID=A0AB36RGQ0_9HYPH|nr:HNH endonuclease [Mesorhizobium mediterraneum]PAQ03698.1 hypothetical protein CIT25_04060 [Mesorhizobium mediterraneum]WIW52403.1 HNH endonuclease [Mesorhizobium mediterraneum]
MKKWSDHLTKEETRAFVGRLREGLSYDPETGLFTNLKRRTSCSVGTIVGGLNDQGYVMISFEGRGHRAHCLAFAYMTGAFAPHEIDHKDRDRANNKWGNLRPATVAENKANTKVRVDNATGLKGVNKKRRRFAARIHISGQVLHLGVFDTAQDAHQAYLKAAKAHYGEFARAA